MVQTTSTIYQSGVTSYGRLDLANAAAAGDEIVYVVNDIRDTFEVRNGAILSIGTGAGSGTAAFVQSCGSVYSTPNPVDSSFPDKVRIMGMTISAGAQVHVGNNDTLFVSATSNGIAEKMKNCSAPVGARGDISIAYNGDASGAVASSASLFLDDGAMLSGGGYLGGVADKGAAQTWGSNQTQSSGALQASRTGAISAGNKVKVKVDGDWAVIGDVSTVGADTVFGNDDEITIGGNIGVFMNTVLRIGDRVHISQTGQNGSGIFVGSGAKMLVGNDASIYARGGFGAGYSGKYSAAIISIGSGASITLDHQADGVFAAEAGAVVTIGDGATIDAAMLSVGYAQNPNNGSFIAGEGAASMQIGNNATVDLMTEALFDDPTEFQIAQKGYIVLDNNAAQMTMLTFGSHANLLGSGISVGDLIKQYVIPNDPARFGSYAGKTFLWGNAAASNKLTFGAGASVNLNGGGIEVNGTSDSIVFSGGTINIVDSNGLTSAISNTISAGWISMGSSFKVLTDSNGVSTLVTYGNTGNNSITFGDDFNIDLQQNAATGATGNLTADGSKDVYSFGNNLRLNANSIYLGQFSHTYSGIDYTATPTGVSITFGNNANIMLSGGFIMNSANAMYMSMGDSGNLSIASGFLFNNLDANGAVLVGNNANIMMNSGFDFSNGGSAGSVTFGNDLNLSTGSGFNFNNSLASGSIIVGSNAHMNINGGFNFSNGGSYGSVTISNGLDLSTAGGFSYSNKTYSGALNVGSNAHMNINGDFNFSNGGVAGAELIGDNASIVISNGFNYSNGGNRGSVTIGNSGHIDIGAGFNFVDVGDKGSLSIGDDFNLSTGSGFSFLNTVNFGSMVVGSNAHMNINGGFNFSNGGNSGSVTIGNGLDLSTAGGFSYSNKTYSGALNVGSNAHMNINGDFNFSNGGVAGAELIGDNASIVISNGFNYSNGGNRGSVTIGNSGHIDIGAGFNFVDVGDKGSLSIGDDFNLSTGNGFSFLNTVNLGSMNVGSNAHMNINGGFNFSNGGDNGSVTIGNNLNLSTGSGFNFSNGATSGAMVVGSNALMNINGGFNFSNGGAGGAELIGDNASVAISNGFNFSNGGANGNLSIGSRGHIDVGSGFTFSNGGSAGSLTVGNYTELNVKNDFAFTNVGASAAMAIGSGVNLNIGSNFSIYNSDLGKVSFGDAATVKVGSSLNVFNNGANGAINVGSSDNISVAGSFGFVNSGSAGSINIGASTTIIADNGFSFVNSGASGAFLAQDNISIKAGGSGFTFVNSGSTGASMTVGNSANFDINGNFQYLNPGSGNSGNEPLSVGSSGIFNITSNFIVVGSSAAAIFGAYTSMVVGGNVSMLEDYSAVVSSAGYQYGSYTDLSIGSNMSICGSNIHFNADISNTISVGGSIILKGDAGVWSKGEGGTLNASGISVLGGPDSKGSAIANESFVVGANNIVTISNGGLLVDVANGQYVQGDGGTLDTLGDITIKGAGAIFSAGNDFVISTHGNGITLDSGATSFTIGNNAILDTDGGIISMGSGVSTAGTSANNIVIGSNASINIGGIQYGGLTQSVAIAAQAHGNLGNIIMNGRADKLAIGNDANLSIGNVALNSSANQLLVGSGATLNMNTLSVLSNGTVNIGDNASVSILGSTNLAGVDAGITISNNAVISMADLNMQGTGAYTSIGNGATLDTGNIILNGDTEKLVIGSNASINTGDIVFNAASQLMSIGNGANASFGDVVLMGSGGVANRPTNSIVVGSGSYGANNMTMGVGVRNTLTLGSGAYWSVNNLIFSAIGSAAANSTTLANILLQSGATLIVDNMTGIGLSPTNKVFIRASAGGNVIIHSGFFDTVSNATSANALDVNFTGATTNPVIFEYDGDIKDTEGKLTLRGLPAMTDNTKLIFNLGKDTKYTDQNRFKTVYEKGTAGNNIMIVQYMSVETGEWEEVARFSVPQWGGPTATNPANILVVKQADGSYKMTITKCFLSGTHIMTENGERVVEELAVGDQIITFKNGKEVLQTIVWVGSMDVDVNNYSNKETLYPIRIKAHAFGLNQPHRDLLVTPEHTVYVDGGLTPARMLVNGRSIIVDKSIEKYTVHHIETIEHSIILSENLLTESYLNTDNKDMFNGEAVNLRLEFNENAGHKSWEEDAAAPLVVAREKVEPIWQRLDRRATQLGFATVERAKTTRDPALCLTTQKGDVIKPVDIQGKVYSFYLPANVRVIGLRSRAAQPAEAVGPFWDDRRMLGVLVSKFTVLGDEAVTVLPSEMSEVSGWYPAEEGRSDRWTKGLAILPQEVSEISNKVRLLKVELTDSSIYLLDEEGDWAKTA